MDLIDLLIRLLTGLVMLWFTGTSSSVPTPPSDGRPNSQTYRALTNISSVEVIVLESFPMQVQLHIRGEHPDGCEFPVVVEQRREGNTVTVEVYREVPIDVMCPMILRPYDDTIRLDGTFEPGHYVFQVNDFIVEQTL
jgi:inhibitor of cysteine peptidase